MPDLNIDENSKIPRETFPYEIKINSGEKTSLFSYFKGIGINNVLGDD